MVIEHFIGIDETIPNALCYCLVRHVNGKADNIIMAKQMDNKTIFNKEVKQLSKIFSAKIIKEI